MRWGWLAVAALFGVAAISVYGAFQSPTFVSGLVIAALSALAGAVAPVIAKRMSPEEEAQWREAERAGRGEEWLRKRRGGPPKD